MVDSEKREIEVTPEMMEAGLNALASMEGHFDSVVLVEAVFWAMRQADTSH